MWSILGIGFMSTFVQKSSSDFSISAFSNNIEKTIVLFDREKTKILTDLLKAFKRPPDILICPLTTCSFEPPWKHVQVCRFLSASVITSLLRCEFNPGNKWNIRSKIHIYFQNLHWQQFWELLDQHCHEHKLYSRREKWCCLQLPDATGIGSQLSGLYSGQSDTWLSQLCAIWREGNQASWNCSQGS